MIKSKRRNKIRPIENVPKIITTDAIIRSISPDHSEKDNPLLLSQEDIKNIETNLALK